MLDRQEVVGVAQADSSKLLYNHGRNSVSKSGGCDIEGLGAAAPSGVQNRSPGRAWGYEVPQKLKDCTNFALD